MNKKFAQVYSPTQVHNQPHWHLDDAAAELSDIFISAATMSLKRRFKKITDKQKKMV
jgi:hypothetical protein